MLANQQELLLAEQDRPFMLLAPGKINLALHVVGRREDGYHLIETLTVFTRFGDRVIIEGAEEDSFSATGPFANAVPTDEDNLVITARDRLRTAFPLADCPPVSITLEKNVPVASGLGGGSSDAATTLLGLASAWHLATNKRELAQLGPALGADVPMCVAAKPLVASGIGEKIAMVPDFPELSLVLVNPGVPVPTANVFRALKSYEHPGLPALPHQLSLTSLVDWLGRTRNDLESAARSIAPEIDDTLHELGLTGSLVARMSGSGATCFGLFENDRQAQGAARHIMRERPGWFVVATRSGGAGHSVQY
jgi:4-diphosphocytidyl-2-C-methyl-D-erythritol kinase